jgi:hypothetical protein
MTIERFAEEHKLRVSRDESGDHIICGKRGHLYVDAGAVCAMWTDGPAMKQSRLAELGGTFWQGDIGRDARGRRVQDAHVRASSPRLTSWQLSWSARDGGCCQRPNERRGERECWQARYFGAGPAKEGTLPAYIASEGRG